MLDVRYLAKNPETNSYEFTDEPTQLPVIFGINDDEIEGEGCSFSFITFPVMGRKYTEYSLIDSHFDIDAAIYLEQETDNPVSDYAIKVVDYDTDFKIGYMPDVLAELLVDGLDVITSVQFSLHENDEEMTVTIDF